ncbi:WXG100 family type VII secretion target [Streptomyces sp. TRM68367]|uniref:WXG100 family type VII secretion target n=1 Tax=Streptomyces sp. TRM68367 TaxID=2758415 RepID=UPI00165AB87F|nr:WXG100 family type VII secretion target [Streptomyces sp. TRM68367]MBC9731321.1 WXG100 family type VII secretion target [Streptomyces sp. TRM68367]
MSDYFAVDPESLARNAPHVRAYSDQFREFVGRLQSGLDSCGECWGDDPMGKAFASQYLNPRDEMLKGLNGTVDVLDSTGDGLETMAKGFAQTEDQNVANARRLGGSGDTYTGPSEETRTPGGSHGTPRP